MPTTVVLQGFGDRGADDQAKHSARTADNSRSPSGSSGESTLAWATGSIPGRHGGDSRLKGVASLGNHCDFAPFSRPVPMA
jgi:hypothetical protein